MKAVNFGDTSLPCKPGRAKLSDGKAAAHATANKAPERITSASLEDSSKPGSVRPWHFGRHYMDRPTARNKTVGDSPAPGMGIMDLFD